MGPQRVFGMTPWVRRLFVANLVVFLFQMTIFVDPRFLSTFGFVPLRALAQPWTFLTYMFLHAGPLHLAFNLLALFVFGPEVEERMGGGPFLAYYLLCGLGGAVLSFVLMQFRSVELVRVLDKISARGIESLTPAERKFLAEMSRKMRDRH